MCDPNKPLSDKHKAVVNEYFRNPQKNKAAAYELVYGCSHETALKSSAELFKKLEKHPYFLEKTEEFERNCGVSFQWYVSELLDSLDIYKGRKRVIKTYKEGDAEVLLHNPQAADATLDKIAKVFGYYKDIAMKLELEGAGKDGAIDVNVKLD